MRLLLFSTALLGLAACSSVTPLPDVRGSAVRPLNPTKWDYETALLAKQKEIGVTPALQAGGVR